ncbi:MAG: hypothetical protein HYY23_00060 [Verrucomicrobia bacterium]|nr:hypothetical protein [Verrucomicrobiota bacterium]
MKTNAQKNNSGLKNRSEQLSTGNKSQINFARRSANRSLDTEKLLALLRSEVPSFYSLAEVVGKWVWIQFPEKQSSEVTRALSEFGFHWNRARQAWQHPCALNPDVAATFDPRQKYGSYFAADIKPA